MAGCTYLSPAEGLVHSEIIYKMQDECILSIKILFSLSCCDVFKRSWGGGGGGGLLPFSSISESQLVLHNFYPIPIFQFLPMYEMPFLYPQRSECQFPFFLLSLPFPFRFCELFWIDFNMQIARFRPHVIPLRNVLLFSNIYT